MSILDRQYLLTRLSLDPLGTTEEGQARAGPGGLDQFGLAHLRLDLHLDRGDLTPEAEEGRAW